MSSMLKHANKNELLQRTLCIKTVPHKPLRPALLSLLVNAQSSPTTTISTLIPCDFATSAAFPKFKRSPKVRNYFSYNESFMLLTCSHCLTSLSSSNLIGH